MPARHRLRPENEGEKGGGLKGQRAEMGSVALPLGGRESVGVPGCSQAAPHLGSALASGERFPGPLTPALLPRGPSLRLPLELGPAPDPRDTLKESPRLAAACPSRPPDSFSVCSTAPGSPMPQVAPSRSSPNICAAFGFSSSFLDTLFSLDSEGPACSWF